MKKLLIWDADETLWSGTLLENKHVTIAPERIELIRELRDRGVLQSIASQNLLSDVLAVIGKHELEDCFLVPQACLDEDSTKSFMIKVIMEELGIVKQTDVAYVDDSAFNNGEVMAAFPGITCALPSSIDLLVKTYFTKSTYNDDDRNRVRRYRSEQDRKRAAVEYNGGYLDFLRSCNMKAVVRVPTEGEMDRVIDLIERANQFSIVNKLITNSEIMDRRRNLRCCWSVDSYGENGLVGVILMGLANIDIIVVSCRMQGKGIGTYLLGSVLNEHVGSEVCVFWRKTEYNGAMTELLKYFGFKELHSSSVIQAHSLLVERPVTLPDWIAPL